MKLAARVTSLFVLAFSLVILPHGVLAQTPVAPVAQRITAAIDSQNLTTMRGNVHPLARAEFDRGAAADAQTLRRMLLLLKRSAEQESALQELLGEQQDKASGQYHGWLTPEHFGAQFGPADADIRAVTQWLESQGFSGVVVSAGRTTIEFSGNAGQVRNAFHTEIRRYAVRGETHFANASDPAIPAALAPVVAGIVSLNNFPIQSHLHRLGTFQKSLKTGETQPLFTLSCGGGLCFGVGPADFAKIYNSQPLLSGSPKIDGTGQGIAIVGESNINVQDVKDFRTMFGLSQNFSASNVIVNGEDPGINDSEVESDLDVQWAGAAAPGARIDFVTSASTETTPGINLSALYIVDHNLDAVMSESFGACEKTIGTTSNQFFNALWQQASAQGITVVVSAGDNGSAGCDNFNTQDTATRGLAVSGFASTPYNVAVGGTDFDQATKIPTYWNTTQTPTTLPIPASAKSYIPEIPWNDTCAAAGISACTTANAMGIAAGSGGTSTLYAKPSWQAGKGVPADGHRDVPDISLFAGAGSNFSFYIICQSDATQVANCNLNAFQITFQGVGGTSASAPAFAGIMALVNQKLATGGNPTPRQGNANYYLYALAQQQNTANLSCNSSSAPVATCSFNDVTKGNNDVPCTGASTNCSGHVASTPGVLAAAASPTVPAFTTTAGYDLATGLGSLNVQNVVNKWSTVNNTATTTALTLNGGSAVNITHGAAVPYQISVGPATASGDASLIATPTGNTVGIGPFTLASGAASGSTTALPGGTSYNVVAHYEGNGTDAPSNSSPVTVTVAPEASKVFITVPTFNPGTGAETSATPTTVVYGSPYILRADVTNAAGSLSALCKPLSCPSGTVTFADTVGGISQGAPNSGTFTLNSSGYTENLPVQLPGGSNTITATYSGDGSFSASGSPASYTLNVTPTPTQIGTPTTVSSPVFATSSVEIIASLATHVANGIAPSGTITFFDGATQIPGTVILDAHAGSGGMDSGIQGDINVIFPNSGNHNLTAKYSGDPSYAASTSAVQLLHVEWQTALTATPGSNNVDFGQSIPIAATVTTSSKGPAMTGSFVTPSAPGSFPGIAGMDANGNETLSATFPVTPPATGLISIIYSGDSNYDGSNTSTIVTVNLPDFSLTPSSSTPVLTANQQIISTTMTLTPTNSVASTVTLQCTVPSIFNTTCSVTPASVALNGQPVNLTVKIAADGSGISSQIAPKAKAKRKSIVSIWLNNDWWNSGWAAMALVMLALACLPGSRKSRSLRIRLALSSALLMAIGCGGGGSSSGGSGGSSGGGSTGGTTSAPVDSTVTMSLDLSKTTLNTRANATAKVTASRTPMGLLEFDAKNWSPGLSAPTPLNAGSVTSPLQPPAIGFYQVYAQYLGDPNTNASTSATLPLTITGDGNILIEATNGVVSRTTSVDVQVQ